MNEVVPFKFVSGILFDWNVGYFYTNIYK